MSETPAHNETAQVAGFGLAAYLLAFLAGCVSAVSFVQIFGGSWLSIMLAYASPLTLYFVGLGAGRKPVVAAALVGIVVVLLNMGDVVAILYALMIALPAMIMSRVSLIRKGGHWLESGVVLQSCLLLGTVLLLLTAVWLEASGIGIAKVMASVAEKYQIVLQQMHETGNLPAEQIERAVHMFTQMLPGLVMVSWLFVHLINISIAQWVLAESKKAIRPDFHVMRTLSLPPYVAVAFVGSLAGAGIVTDDNMNMVFGAMSALLGMGFTVVGLVIQHGMLNTLAVRQNLSAFARFMLFAFYYVVLMAVPIPLFLAPLMGVVDPWIKFRTKLNLIV